MVLVFVFILFITNTSANLMQYDEFFNLNKTCFKTWRLLETSLNLTKITRFHFDQGNFNFFNSYIIK